MKTNLLTLIGLTIIIIGCRKNKEIDKTNIFEIGNHLNESLLKNDTLKFKKLFEYNMDSLYKHQKEKYRKIRKQFNEKKFEFITIDTIDLYGGFVSIKNSKGIKLYYKSENNNFWLLEGICKKDSIGNLNVSNLHLTNINENCKKEIETPYCPNGWGLMDGVNYKTNGKTIINCSVRVKNNLGEDFNFIKFRLKLTDKKSNTVFFNQTIESNKKNFKGDLTLYKIPQLNNYYTGFIVNNRNTNFETTLIEIKPKPISEWCQKLDSLKNTKK